MSPITSYKRRYISLPDGKTLEYVRRPGGTEPLILIHGYADSWYSFKGVLDYLPSRFAAFAPSLPGHGGSSKPEGGYSIDGYASDILAFMTAMGVPKAAIVGHSMGTFIAQSIALTAPDRVSRMVLIATAPTADNAVLRSFHRETQGLSDPVGQDFARSFQSGTCVNPIDSTMSMEDIVRESSLLPAHVWSAALQGLIDYRPADFDSSALYTLRTPTLVLGGCLDEIFDESAQRKLASALPNAEIWLDLNSGHSINWESPERTASQVAQFLAVGSGT
ncbi:pimeloyl-ACP methyl ester carboxylesterase [Pseudaminobacter salicylatoxidans]|uniref:Pimeloyl-ACP methyl ester carboxylesterase n=1 Tax=Pseudaminobacter salicylatoxidans TaxID=93369 RepID=A0A316C949_PSESE|nr:alpha/beta hydrolase [Pseudaminobacter salicylatoxidans]PWJ84557.1 pimeloyl-ACP methyl ester carboxylesterase [Pseudaminobacter salicylatoxidans]